MQDIDRDYLISGIKYGFKILQEEITGEPVYRKNYESADGSNKDKIEAQIIDEINNNRYIVCSNRPHIVSSLGAITKDDGNVRLIPPV